MAGYYCQKRCFVKINIFDEDFLFKHSIRDHDFWYPFWYPKVIYMSLFYISQTIKTLIWQDFERYLTLLKSIFIKQVSVYPIAK